MLVLAAVAVALGGPAGNASSSPAEQDSERFRAMNRPVEPFHMIGNLYYVGANSVTAFLLTSSEGHVLIDGGFPETADMIMDSIEKLGFRIEDVEVLLNSHAHFDHAGGLAALKAASGAELWISEGDADVVELGGLGDPLMGDAGPFPAVKVDHRFVDGETITLGSIELTARVTAGHTRGCTSWDFEIEDAGQRWRAVSVCSLTVLPGTQFGEDPTYPGIRQDYEEGLSTLRGIPVDVFLAAHAGFFKMRGKRRQAEAGAATNPFIDRAGYHGYLDRAEAALSETLKEQGLEQQGLDRQ
jgi:metallo-beta-lactamase class B